VTRIIRKLFKHPVSGTPAFVLKDGALMTVYL
jgi:hypothetical protein